MKNELLSTLTYKGALEAHSKPVFSICIMKNGKLASGSIDNTIKIFDISTKLCEMTLVGHTDWVMYISLLSNESLISCSKDTAIKIWVIKDNSYSCPYTLTGHTDTIYKVIELSDNRFGSCSCDRTIKIWDSVDNHCIITLDNNTTFVKSLIELKNKIYIVSASDDLVIFWDNKNYEIVKIFEDIYCCSSNSLLEIHNQRIVIGDFEKLMIINANTFQIESKFDLEKGVGGVHSLIELKNGNLLCGCKGILVQVDLNQFKSISSKSNIFNQDIGGLVELNDLSLICSSVWASDIKVWQF